MLITHTILRTTFYFGVVIFVDVISPCKLSDFPKIIFSAIRTLNKFPSEGCVNSQHIRPSCLMKQHRDDQGQN